jgi:hypothetical protein
MFGLPVSKQVTVRYIGTYLATGAYVSNWAALNAYQANNIVGQWKRATIAAAVSACNGLGGIAGSFIVRQQEAPWYPTAVWVSIGSHVLMIVIVLGFSVWFAAANRLERSGKVTIEGVVCSPSLLLIFDCPLGTVLTVIYSLGLDIRTEHGGLKKLLLID